jgi:hypothetical protein
MNNQQKKAYVHLFFQLFELIAFRLKIIFH